MKGPKEQKLRGLKTCLHTSYAAGLSISAAVKSAAAQTTPHPQTEVEISMPARPFETHSHTAPPALRQAFHQHVELVPRSRLIPPPRNARTHSKKQIRQIANSILRFGWTYAILIDENGNILAGFGRYKAAELLGLQHVPVIVISGLSEAEKPALALADNKIAANAGWDRPALAAELGELAILLPECNLDIEITGFEPAEIDALMGDLVDSEQEPADELPQIAKHAVSARGDLWKLGHQLLGCADATNERRRRTSCRSSLLL